MAKTTLVVNSECIAHCLDYEAPVLAAEARFIEQSETADIDDTFEVACGIRGCEIRDELYLKVVRGHRLVKHGIFGNDCILNILDNSSQL